MWVIAAAAINHFEELSIYMVQDWPPLVLKKTGPAFNKAFQAEQYVSEIIVYPLLYQFIIRGD